jgi:hypothetical protein
MVTGELRRNVLATPAGSFNVCSLVKVAPLPGAIASLIALHTSITLA